MAKGSYSDDDKKRALAALIANGGNLLRTANETGYPRKTIAYWARDLDYRGDPPPQDADDLPAGAQSATRALANEANDAQIATLAHLQRAAAARAIEALPRANAAEAMRAYEIAERAERAATAASGRRVQLPRFTYKTPDGRPLPSDAEPLPEGAYTHPNALAELSKILGETTSHAETVGPPPN